jgi:hypothetical protein
MSVNEFKAWLEGFVHSFVDGTPSKEQWQTIQEKVATIYPSKVR